MFVHYTKILPPEGLLIDGWVLHACMQAISHVIPKSGAVGAGRHHYEIGIMQTVILKTSSHSLVVQDNDSVTQCFLREAACTVNSPLVLISANTFQVAE